MIFLPIILFIVNSQNQYKHYNDEVIEVKIGFLKYHLIFLMILLICLCFTFLFVAYKTLFAMEFTLTNSIVGCISSFLFLAFCIPIANIYNHLWRESKRQIYFFRNKKTLLIVEKQTEITIDLEDQMKKINQEVPRKSSKYQTNLGKYNFILNDKIVSISDAINFPQDFLDHNKIEQVKVSKLFIWI